jgi:diacylglycerol kinase family enzyme
MSRKIIYFINPIAGIKNKEALLKTIEARTQQQNIPYEILQTNINGNYFFLKEKIDTENITDVVICGRRWNHQSNCQCINRYRRQYWIIPMGSGNGLAFAAKIPNRAEKALDIIFKGRSSYIDSFFINEVFSCMLCGLGFDAQVAHDFSRQPKRGLKHLYKAKHQQLYYGKALSFSRS